MTLAKQMASLADEVAALEHTVENQLSIIAELEQGIKARDELIDMVGPDIEWKESHVIMSSSTRMQKIVEVYRQLRPAMPNKEAV
jgi:hypothetical protein